MDRAVTNYNVPEPVAVDLRADGQTFTGTYGPGDTELPEPVAQLLQRLGKASPAPTKPTTAPPKPTSKTKD